MIPTKRPSNLSASNAFKGAKMQKTYRVVWDIELDASSPLEAAKFAKEIQLDPKSTANVFDVNEMDENDQDVDDSVMVDLDNPEKSGDKCS